MEPGVLFGCGGPFSRAQNFLAGSRMRMRMKLEVGEGQTRVPGAPSCCAVGLSGNYLPVRKCLPTFALREWKHCSFL